MAGRFSIEAIFRAVDRVSAPISRMQNRVGRFTRSMSRGLRSANRMVDGLVRGMGRGVKTVAKFGGAIIGLGAAAAITAMNRAADAADSLAKQSRRLQFPIEALQEWKFVAEQSGVSNELLDNSFGAFSKRLGEAKGGMGPLVSGLKKLNPELLKQVTSADSISDAFGLYINAIRDADSATEKAALANAAFSRSGLNLVNIADNSASSIKKMREEQRENGNITMQQAVAAEAYNDPINALKKSLIGMIQQVLLPMLPAITKMLKAWRDWVVANKEMIQTKIATFIEDLKSQIKALVLAVVEFNKEYNIADLLGEGLDKLGRFAGFLKRNGVMILSLVGGVVALSLVLKTMAVAMAAVNLVMSLNPIGLVVLAIAALVAGIILLINYFGGFEAIAESVTSAWSGVAAFFTDLWGGVMDTFADAWDFIGEIVDKIKGAVDFVANAAGRVSDAAGSAVDSAKNTVSNAASKVSGFFGFGDDNAAVNVARPNRAANDSGDAQQIAGGGSGQMVSPQERIARSVEETRSTSSSEVTIRDETGRAQVTRGKMGAGLKLQQSGAFN